MKMLSRLQIYGLTIMLILLVCSCGNKNQKVESTGNVEADEIIAVTDTAFQGWLKEIDGDSLVFLQEKTGEMLVLSAQKAKNENKILGSVKLEDRYSIISNSSNSEIELLVNLSNFVGRWIYDEELTEGMIIEENGIISPINPQDRSFRNWDIHNGNLLLYYVDMQQTSTNGKDYHVIVSHLVGLTEDEMDLKVGEKFLHCTRLSSIPKKIKF